MTRRGNAGSRPRRKHSPPRLEILEGRELPTGAGFLSAIGVGVNGTGTSIRANAVATDSSGDLFVAGSYRGTVSFGPGNASGTVSTSNSQDAFVAKYGPTDALIWVVTFAGRPSTGSGGGSISEVGQASALAVDGSGNVFVAGAFEGTIALTGPSGVTQVSSVASATEPYVAKLAPTGLVSWFDAFSGTATDTDSASALGLDGSGGAVVAGSFSDTLGFGAYTLSAGGQSDAYAARVDGSGTVLWVGATRGSNGSVAGVAGLAVDGSGNVDLAGSFAGSVDFDPSSSTTSLVSNGGDDAMFWKLDSAGKFVWARSFGSTDYDAATAVAVDASGDVYATGAFSDTVAFGSTSIAAGPIFDAFVLKLTPGGLVSWADGLVGSSGSSKGQGVAVDASGEAHVAGTFSGPLDFDPGPGVDSLSSVGSSDAFLAGYDSSGNLLYALQAGQVNFNAALGIANDSGGTVALAGTYSGSLAFGSSTLPSFSSASFFVGQANVQASPPTPSAPILEASSDTGPSQTDGITSVKSPTLDVNAAVAADTVELLRNGVVVAQRTGPGALLDSGPLADGTYSYTAVQVSPQGLASLASPSESVTILTVPPAAPPPPILDPADDSGTAGDGITNVRLPRLSVVAKGGTTIQWLDASGVVIGSTFAPADGTVLVMPGQPLADGTYAIRSRAVDLAGNLGAASSTISLTIDATPPAAPSALALLAADDSGTLGDNLTNIRQPRLTGHAEPGSMVQVFNGSGAPLGQALAGSDGTFMVKVSSPLSDGSYSLSSRSTDAAGNVGMAGPSLSLTILATPPRAPSSLSILASDVSGPAGGTLTNVRQPHITGSGPASLTIDLLNSAGAILGVTTSSTTGGFTAQVASPLSDGVVTLDAVAVDAAGNLSLPGPSFSLTIDATPPAAPSALVLLAADDSGTLGDNLTNVRQPRLTGHAEPGSTVQVFNGSGASLGQALAGSDGTFMVKVSSPLSDGSYSLSSRSTDAAGNVGPAGSSLSLIILATPPATPAAPTIVLADDSAGPNLTNVRQPRLTGTTIPGVSVQLVDVTNTPIGSSTSGTNGVYVIKPTNPLGDGTYAFHALVTDPAGNVSAAGLPLTLTILATPPLAPSAPTLLAQDDSGTVGDRLTNVRQPRLTGQAASGLTVRLLNGSGVTIGSATASSTGSVTVTPTSPLADGTYALSFVAVDPATNVSLPGGTLTLTVLATPPAAPPAPALLASELSNAPIGATSLRRPVIAGTALPGGRVDWLAANGSVVASATASLTTGAYQIQPPTALINATYPVKVRVTDPAGNVSPFSPSVNVTVRVEPGDDFGNSVTDLSVFTPTNATFTVQQPATAATFAIQFGGAGDIPINGDFFGNGHNDIAIYRPSNSAFYAYDPVTKAVKVQQLGQVGDIPVPGDYDGDGQSDFAVFHPSTDTFTILMSATNTTYAKAFGGLGFIPVPADYFGNGHADIAVYWPASSTFFVLDQVTGTTKVVAVGPAGSIPIEADFEGVGHVDPAVFQPSTATFSILMSATNAVYTRQFGGIGDIPIPGDFFGVGRVDVAIYRPSTATFYAIDIPTNAIRVATWGTPNLTLPTLSPITTWFNFGGGSTKNAIGRPGSRGSGLTFDEPAILGVPLTTDVLETPTPSKKPVDQAIPSLDLDGWRP